MPRGPLVAMMLVVTAVMIFPMSYASAAPPIASSSGSGTIGIRLVAPPGGATGGPLASSYIVEHLAPGAILSRTVELLNNSNTPVNVSVYASAANLVRGQFVYAAGESANELSTWTSISTPMPRLAPHSKKLDTVTLRIPDNASSGDRFAVVWAAVSASPTGGRGITLVSRVGIRMYVSIGPGGAPPSNFVLGPLTTSRSASGDSLIVDQIQNTGKSTLDLSGQLSLSKGPNGLHAGPFVASLGTILAPGASGHVTVSLNSNFPRGPWRAELRVRSGSLQRFASATITFPPRVVAPADSSRLLIASFVIAILLVVAFASTLILSRRRRNFARRSATR